MEQQPIAQCIELLCQQGCIQVRTTIELLEADRAVAEVEGFSPEERRLILEELKAIMAVYDRP